MRALLMGGAGFIGSHFVEHLLSARPDGSVVVLDKLTYAGSLDNLRGARGACRFRFVRGELADRDCVQAVFGEPFDFVFDLAAETHVDRSIADAESFLRTDIHGAYTLLEAAGPGAASSRCRPTRCTGT